MTEENATVRAKKTNTSLIEDPISNSGDLSLDSLEGSRSHSDPEAEGAARESVVASMRLLWEHRKILFRAGVYALLASALLAILIPARYQSVTRLMPPDEVSGSGLGLLSAMAGRTGTVGLGGIASELLGTKNSGAQFVGIIQSQTVQDRLIEQFNLMHVYYDRKIEHARLGLADDTDVSEDRKSGIITIEVTDHDPHRAAAMAHSYVDELD